MKPLLIKQNVHFEKSAVYWQVLVFDMKSIYGFLEKAITVAV